MKYYNIEKKNNLGEQYIGETTFEAIVVHEVSKAEGIDLAGGKNANDVVINDLNQVIINLDIIVSYGLNVNKTVQNLQTAIVETIKNQIGLKQVKVNVDVSSIKF